MSNDVSEAAHTSEMSVNIQLRTQQYIPEDSELYSIYYDIKVATVTSKQMRAIV
jgi:hypothetical protein